jgi:deoxyribodipyrimidine photo-lyase
MTAPPVLVRFRRDLRLDDNPALAAAAAAGPVLPVYLLDDAMPGRWAPGGASRWWLHHSLAALRADLTARGLPLVLRRGDAAQVLPDLAREAGAGAVFWNRRYAPFAVARDAALQAALENAGVVVRSFNAGLLWEPWTIETRTGGPYRVFTPYYKACLKRPVAAAAGPLPRLVGPTDPPPSDPLDAWGLLPTRPDWAGGLRAAWTPGEAGAHERARTFLDTAVNGYADHRDRPAGDATSRLSPHLHFGEIDPRRLWHAIDRDAPGGAAFARELVWREFSHHLLHHALALPETPLRPSFAAFPWRDDPAGLAAWQRGRTGYPLVDAGMRQLWATGWMHNRVRMVAASFLVKHLLIPWQAGAAWFWDTLVDADLANNSASWQWVAGCGTDAAPYFRIFNPVAQSRRFDPDGGYIRSFVPELAGLDAAHIHAPWQAPAGVLAEAGIRLGETYPAPIVDHRAARRRALDAYARIR